MFKIIYVNFPFIDNPHKSKPRPALCLTEGIGKYKIVIVAFITTKRKDSVLTDVMLNESDKGFSATGLKKTSFIRLHKLYSVVSKEIIGELGVVSLIQSKEIKQKLRKLFKI